MEAKSDMVSFRAGALNERLRAGPLTAGGTAKRDLGRYYALLEQALSDWWNGIGVNNETWQVVTAFVGTRYWDTVPLPAVFCSHFESFARSPMANAFSKEAKGSASAALRTADYAAVAAIIDRVEAASQTDREEQGAATAGATSVA